MKIVLVAINSKYIHSNLAVYSLKAYAEKKISEDTGQTEAYSGRNSEIEIAEYTVNQPVDVILRDICARKGEVVCFSCYIWNIQYVETLIRDLKAVDPAVEIWAGGPEVSYNAREMLEQLPQLAGIMRGEGEEIFAGLCRLWRDQGLTEKKGRIRPEGVSVRDEKNQIVETSDPTPVDMNEIPFVYKEMERFENRILYYETSRGCPFSCSYCLSSIDRHMRTRDMALVERELQFFLDQRVSQVKLTDRTFNFNKAHTMAVWNYIHEHDNGVTNFHFEVAADLLGEEELSLLERVRPGLIQLEIGVQSTNPETLCEIRRVTDLDKVRAHVERIRCGQNVHQHLDLIAGLPYEDFHSFVKSFNDVYRMRPNQLQLGFLKVLKGSYMSEMQEEYGIRASSSPPFEVLRTKWVDYSEFTLLKGIEELVEVYYNSGQFTKSIRFLEDQFESPFEMYCKIRDFYHEHKILDILQKRSRKYEQLLDFAGKERPECREELRELLIYDYYLRENAKARPEFAGESQGSREMLSSFYEREALEPHFLKAYGTRDKNQLRRMTHLEYFPKMGEWVLFDYQKRNPLNYDAATYRISTLYFEGGSVYNN